MLRERVERLYELVGEIYVAIWDIEGGLGISDDSESWVGFAGLLCSLADTPRSYRILLSVCTGHFVHSLRDILRRMPSVAALKLVF